MSITRLLLNAALALTCTTSAAAQDKAALERRGHALLEANCSRCHAIERTGDSPHREAPPFRTLSRRYPVDWLQEALAEVSSPVIPTCRNSCSKFRKSTRSWPICNRFKSRRKAQPTGDHVTKRCALLFLATLMSSGSAHAADAGHGEQLARRWCSSCHVVAADQQQ